MAVALLLAGEYLNVLVFVIAHLLVVPTLWFKSFGVSLSVCV